MSAEYRDDAHAEQLVKNMVLCDILYISGLIFPICAKCSQYGQKGGEAKNMRWVMIHYDAYIRLFLPDYPHVADMCPPTCDGVRIEICDYG